MSALTFFSEAAPLKLFTVFLNSTNGWELVFKYMSLWGTFSIETTKIREQKVKTAFYNIV